MKKKQQQPKPRLELRTKFERFIADRLETHADVDTATLAADFWNQEERSLRKLAGASIIQMLVKWADDILTRSTADEIARNGRTQLVLPLNLQGIEVPGAISFISGANKKKWTANYKVVGWQMESHAYILRKLEDEVRASRVDFERLWEAVKPFMEADVKLTLPAALGLLLAKDAGAA